MSDAADLLKKISETMGPASATSGAQTPTNSVEIVDQDQSGKKDGLVRFRPDASSPWESHNAGNQNKASNMVKQLQGKSIDQVRQFIKSSPIPNS